MAADQSYQQQVLQYFREAVEPKTLQESILALSSDTFSPVTIKTTVEELVHGGELEHRRLCEQCSLYWRPKKKTVGKKSSAEGVKQNSVRGRAKPAFKSPASVRGQHLGQKQSHSLEQKSRKVVENDATPSRKNVHPKDVAREVLELKKQCNTAEKEILELTKDYHEDEVQMHIEKLHEYNEIKDVGQLLLGKLAEVEGTTTASLYQQFSLELDD